MCCCVDVELQYKLPLQGRHCSAISNILSTLVYCCHILFLFINITRFKEYSASKNSKLNFCHFQKGSQKNLILSHFGPAHITCCLLNVTVRLPFILRQWLPYNLLLWGFFTETAYGIFVFLLRAVCFANHHVLTRVLWSWSLCSLSRL